MYSETVDGKVLDYRFRQVKELPYIYDFFIGDIYIGKMFKMKKGSWSAVSAYPNALFPIAGFKSRLDCAEILLKHWRNVK